MLFLPSVPAKLSDGGEASAGVYAQIYSVSEHWDVGLRDQSPLKI